MKFTFLLSSFLGFSSFDEYLFDFLYDFLEPPNNFFCSLLASRLVPIWHLIPNIFVSQTKLAFWLEWMISDVVEGVFNWVLVNIHENVCVHFVHTFVSLHSKKASKEISLRQSTQQFQIVRNSFVSDQSLCQYIILPLLQLELVNLLLVQKSWSLLLQKKVLINGDSSSSDGYQYQNWLCMWQHWILNDKKQWSKPLMTAQLTQSKF